ncbi:hypothetical protein [Burkholderia gladioli]|uniref:hypothetical protein n=1 Tax=Burkholderia gladioli TaxID=28095 RepID=UPI001641D51E|nr:hypothetical protein [Burkholderia gladioli]
MSMAGLINGSAAALVAAWVTGLEAAPAAGSVVGLARALFPGWIAGLATASAAGPAEAGVCAWAAAANSATAARAGAREKARRIDGAPVWKDMI